MTPLLNKIKGREARVAVVGLGYVGLPLAVEFAKAGFKVLGIDLDLSKVEKIRSGQSYIPDVPSEDLNQCVIAGRFEVSSDYSRIRECDAVSICVPTPLRKTKDPDLSFIVEATEQISKYVHKDLLVVLESTTYPGTTEEIVMPAILKNGFQIGRDVFLAFSPERIDPGNLIFKTHNTPKVIGGITPRCLELATTLYSSIVEKVIPVSSTQAAEMVKILENTFRAVNIGLVNEMAVICRKLNLNVWEIIEAAGTKPFGFMKFYPGPGLGGHCIPVDPHYLSWKLKGLDYNARFIQLASEVNAAMPAFVVDKVVGVLNAKKMSVNGAQIMLLGISYKKNVGDLRESPALEILRLLSSKGARLSFHDPYIPELVLEEGKMFCVRLTDQKLREQDCVVIVTDHDSYDWSWIVANCKAIVDTRNATRGICHEKTVVSLL